MLADYTPINLKYVDLPEVWELLVRRPRAHLSDLNPLLFDYFLISNKLSFLYFSQLRIPYSLVSPRWGDHRLRSMWDSFKRLLNTHLSCIMKMKGTNPLFGSVKQGAQAIIRQSSRRACFLGAGAGAGRHFILSETMSRAL